MNPLARAPAATFRIPTAMSRPAGCKSRQRGRNSPLMSLLRALMISCLMVAVPTTALAGAIDQGHCKMKDMSGQDTSAPMDHSMHAGHVMDESVSVDQSAHVQASKAANGCNCGCNCSSNHCASSSSGFLSADLGGGLIGRFVDRHELPFAVAHISAAHHLDLIRPPALA